MVGVNVLGHEPKKLKEVMNKEQITWRSISSRAITSQWDAGTPTYFVLDGKGIIRYKWVGSPGEKPIEMALEKLLHEAENHTNKPLIPDHFWPLRLDRPAGAERSKAAAAWAIRRPVQWPAIAAGGSVRVPAVQTVVTTEKKQALCVARASLPFADPLAPSFIVSGDGGHARADRNTLSVGPTDAWHSPT